MNNYDECDDGVTCTTCSIGYFYGAGRYAEVQWYKFELVASLVHRIVLNVMMLQHAQNAGMHFSCQMLLAPHVIQNV